MILSKQCVTLKMSSRRWIQYIVCVGNCNFEKCPECLRRKCHSPVDKFPAVFLSNLTELGKAWN